MSVRALESVADGALFPAVGVCAADHFPHAARAGRQFLPVRKLAASEGLAEPEMVFATLQA